MLIRLFWSHGAFILIISSVLTHPCPQWSQRNPSPCALASVCNYWIVDCREAGRLNMTHGPVMFLVLAWDLLWSLGYIQLAGLQVVQAWSKQNSTHWITTQRCLVGVSPEFSALCHEGQEKLWRPPVHHHLNVLSWSSEKICWQAKLLVFCAKQRAS